ncbi:hypothetical protein OH117_30570, partial [Pseudomonas aeruginosa]|nr:hypothetical protein [Pseudomonas aeruginosa]
MDLTTEHILDFEWRPLQNYLRDRGIPTPPIETSQQLRSCLLYTS